MTATMPTSAHTFSTVSEALEFVAWAAPIPRQRLGGMHFNIATPGPYYKNRSWMNTQRLVNGGLGGLLKRNWSVRVTVYDNRAALRLVNSRGNDTMTGCTIRWDSQ